MKKKMLFAINAANRDCDAENVELRMLNGYLNGYAEMLAASTFHDRTKIELDRSSYA